MLGRGARVDIRGPSRKRIGVLSATWVRIPPSPPKFLLDARYRRGEVA